jgi:hypothetical protein
MIRFFKSSFPVQYIVIGLTSLILWSRAFFSPPSMPPPSGFVPFYSFLSSFLSVNPLIPVIAGFLLVTISAYLFNRLVTYHEIVQKNSALSGLMFIILMSYYPGLLTLNQGNISVFFLLLVLMQLLTSYNNEEPYDLIFSAGFFTAVGTLFYFPFIFFYGFILISFIFFRSANWREWVSSLLGFSTPFLFLTVYFFWFDKLKSEVLLYFSSFTIHYEIPTLQSPAWIILTSVVVIFSLYSLTNGFRRTTEKTIEIRRKSLLLNWILFFSLASIPFSSGLLMFHTQLFFIPFSSIIALYLLQLKKFFWQELSLLFLLLMVLFNNLFFLFP